MRELNRSSLRRLWCGCAACACLFPAMQGCGSKTDDTAASSTSTAGAQTVTKVDPNAPDAELRKSYTQKGFDINSVPPAQREQVRALMQQNSKPASAGK